MAKHTSLCSECHHTPSERNTADLGNYMNSCYCKCHDVADAAPDLLEALKLIAPDECHPPCLTNIHEGEDCDCGYVQAWDAIRKAEREP